MHQIFTMGTIFVFVFSFVLEVCASDAPIPSGAGRAELIENELQKVSQWAAIEGREQTQQNFKTIEKKAEFPANLKNEVMTQSERMGLMSEDNLQAKVPLDADQETQDIQQKFAQDNSAVMEKTKAKGYQIANEERKVSDDPSLENAYRESQKSPHQFELATEVYNYKYTEVIGVKVTGIKGGLVGSYQYQLAENDVIHSWSDFLAETSKINIFRLESRFSYGKVEYEGSGTWDGIPDWNFETRGLLGLQLPIREDIVITPFAGLGYRYLYNDFSVYPASIFEGQQYYSGYDRESTYVYIPLGVEVEKKIAQSWALSLKGEIDFFIWGKQVSHLENMVDQNGVNAGYGQLTNDQDSGIGWRVSARLLKNAGRFDFFVEPFFRFWHIEDSDFSFMTNNGSLICVGNLCQGGIEPDNKTWEYGVNLGAKF